MNLFKKSFILFSLLFLFVLGVISIPTYKVDALVQAIDPGDGGGGGGGGGTGGGTGTVITMTASPTSVSYGGSSTISWNFGKNTCVRTDTGASIGASGSFNTGALTSTKTFTINCYDVYTTSQGASCGTFNKTNAYCNAGDTEISFVYQCWSIVSGNWKSSVTCQTPSITRSATVTVTTPTTSGTISATNCEVKAGASTCEIVLKWDTVNPITTSAVTTPTNITVASVNSSPGGTPYNIVPGSRTFYLYNNNKQLAQATATATCAPGTAWINGVCSAGPVVTVTANPANITSGGFSTITWTSTGATSCIRTDTGETIPTNSSINGFIVGPLGKTTTFTITCTDVVVALPRVDGLCDNTVNNSCFKGTLVDDIDSKFNYLWSCAGSNGGITAHCSMSKSALGI